MPGMKSPNTAQKDPNVISLPEAGTRLGKSRNTMYRLAGLPDGKRPEWILRLGGSYVVSVPRMEYWLHGMAA